MSIKTSESTTCVVCNSDKLSHVITINQMPVHCNLIWASKAEAGQAPRGDLQLYFCNNCGHIYNFAFDPKLMEYTQSYENSLHFSPTFQRYAQDLAENLIEQYGLYDKDIIEIGCGQGDFLNLICRLGNNRGFGFDPSYVTKSNSEDKVESVQIFQDYYSKEYQSYPANLIISRHVLEHIQQPKLFIKNILNILPESEEILFFIEVPNILYTLRDQGIWDLIYEHCSYFNQRSLERLFVENRIIPQRIYEQYNGQFLCIEGSYGPKHNGLPTQSNANDLEWIKSLVYQFADQYTKQVRYWEQKLKTLADSGKRTVLWGSGSKGVTFLNTISCSKKIQYVVDINPRKQSKFVAGSGHEIISPELLREYEPDYVIIMNQIYETEIKGILNNLGISAQCLVV